MNKLRLSNIGVLSKLAIFFVCICISNFPVLSAIAATATTTLNITATIPSACTITGGSLSFGEYGLGTTNLDSQTTITVQCINTTPYNIGLDAGQNSGGGGVTARKLTNTTAGGATLNYFLYRDSPRTQNWGNTVGIDTLSGTGTGSNQVHTIYGRVPSGQTASAAAGNNFTDFVVITLYW